MEIRKESLSTLKLCRFCLNEDESLTSLYERRRPPKSSIPLGLKILSCVSIEVFPSDKMPSFICNRCKFFMEMFYEFKQICRHADETILQYVQSGAPLESASWPAPLLKLCRHLKSEVKTVVEGGATIQVTSQDMSDSDEEGDENVYNIKIGDGTDNGSKARIKLVTSQENAEDKPKGRKGKDIEKNDRVVSQRSDVGECWPCDECDCTYPLQQLLDLHKMQKHRARTVQCDQCDAKFFSKYDLMTHQLRHSDEYPFQCVACDKKFKRLVLLKRHEKLLHADLPQQPCPNCPATFLSHEELEAHQKRHTRVADRPFVCSICDKRFHEKGTLQRHIDIVHEKKATFYCDYCPERFASVSKLARHVRSHAGDRAYPCKYCNKSFVKSHHYTRHLRMKHRETIRTCRGPFGEPDQYRCEQCEDSFSTQDELIYHSAIHATQNLTCPLCQEKFDNVDAVTTHIKSHVNGTEFMCDFCELVFTTKEKLDNHMMAAHEDELREVEEAAQDESSMELDLDDEDDSSINVKEEDGEMVVEIKKSGEFMLPNVTEEKVDNTNSEESEVDITYTELATVESLAMPQKKAEAVPEKTSPAKVQPSIAAVLTKTDDAPAEKTETQANILKKADEIKRKKMVQQTIETAAASAQKKEKPVISKPEGNNTTSANDKSLRLLEKELQELKRTNTRTEVIKTPAKSFEAARGRRAQLHTSTPKLRSVEEKKSIVATKTPVVEKKQPERRAVTKENKEPKENKETKGNNAKEEKEKEVPKTANAVKNGANDKSASEEGVRRSTRPSKVKDYAKMVRDISPEESEDENSNDEEYEETEKVETRGKQRRGSIKQSPAVKESPSTPASAAAAPTAGRKRGRPRKDTAIPSKQKKEDVEPEKTEEETVKNESAEESNEDKTPPEEDVSNKEAKSSDEQKPSGVLVSPTGQTLKKVPIKALPPGVKPLPLPVSARSGELCEMQIGKKVVKVQKIVMTKAEVEAMAKKGLVEMKDGTMVLKQGIKLPSADPVAIKSSLVGEGEVGKESPNKQEKGMPMRCNLNEDL